MKTTKRTLSILLAACMLLCCAPLAFAEDPVFTDAASAAAYIRENMVGRKTDITFVYQAQKAKIGELNDNSLSDYFAALWRTMDALVFAHTGEGSEGDYLRSHLARHGCRYSFRYSPQDVFVNYGITVTASYYTTAAQENATTTAVASALSGLATNGKSDYEKVRLITDYICGHVTYDYTNLDNDAYTLKYSAYAALINGTSVCQGYAGLFYRMALEAGLDARIITGQADNGETVGRHAWNIVRVDGKYYNIDTTWIDGTSSDDYFLKGTDNWEDHFPDEDPLGQYTVSASDFDPAAPHIHTDANKDGKCDSCGFVIAAAPAVPQNVKAKVSGSQQITVSYAASSGATQYNIYRYNGAKGEYVYKGTSFTTAYLDKTVVGGTTYYYKVVAVKKTDDLTLVSAKSASANAKAVAAPAKPTNVAAAPAGDGILSITYNASANATQYNIYRYNSTKGAYVYKGTSYTTAFRDKTASGGTTYYYKVAAVNKTGDCTLVSDMSASAHAKALATPAVPQNVTAVSTEAKKVTVSWSRATGATQYNVYRYNSAKKAYVYVGTSYGTSYTVTGLTSGTNYYFKVVAAAKGNGLTFVSEKSAHASARAR